MKRTPLLALVVLTACSSSEPSTNPSKPNDQPGAKAEGASSIAAAPKVAPGAAASSASAVAAAPSASASVAAVDPGPPVCTRSHEKVWGSGANKVTGLTTKHVDNKMAIGFAIGTEPRVLVIDKDGTPSVHKVKVSDKQKAPEAKEGFRSLLRVSPISIKDDLARAFIDYRDDLKSKQRRVSCGPADADAGFLTFDGTSFLDLHPKPTSEEKKKLLSVKGGYAELRDCRTFVSLKSDETWALGSVLHGSEKEDGATEWKMSFIGDFDVKSGDGEVTLHETALKGDPPKLLTYEIPTSRRAQDKGSVIATRFGGSLLVGVLDTKHKLQGKFKSYPGFPTMPDFGRVDDDLILTTGVGSGKEKALRALVISRETLELPAGYVDVGLTHMDKGEGEASFVSPELAIDAQKQRWLAYVEGAKDKAHLRLAPLDKNLKAMGRAFSVTEGEVFASESRITVLDNGKMVIAYLRDTAGKVELVTEQLSCQVRK